MDEFYRRAKVLDKGDIVCKGEVLGSGKKEGFLVEGGFDDLGRVHFPELVARECFFNKSIRGGLFDGGFYGDSRGNSWMDGCFLNEICEEFFGKKRSCAIMDDEAL